MTGKGDPAAEPCYTGTTKSGARRLHAVIDLHDRGVRFACSGKWVPRGSITTYDHRYRGGGMGVLPLCRHINCQRGFEYMDAHP